MPLDGYRCSGGKVVVVARGDRPPHNAITRVAFAIPCGQCLDCRLEKSRQWAMRCLHEAKMSSESSFITLTYRNERLPPGGSLSKTAFQLFMKRLRKAKGNGVRFYGCGEYGDDNMRPHYHALLFNCGFPDRVLRGRNGRGECWYSSAELERLWPDGFNVIGDVTFDSAAYVARYVMKKVTGDKAPDHYAVVDGNGVVYDRLPEFALMSRRPGIGASYYDKYGHEVRAHDSVVINAKEVKPPRFYDLRTKRLHTEDYNKLGCKCVHCLVKRKRKKLAVLNKADNTPERLRVKGELRRRLVAMKTARSVG